MAGTLTFCLPSRFTGGELIVRQDQHEVTVDWATEVLKDGKGSIHWCFLYSDCQHEVLKVTSGYRVTITYDVFEWKVNSGNTLLTTDSRATHLKEYLMRSESFLERGGTLGFGLKHVYPEEDFFWAFSQGSETPLKGVDRALMTAITQLGLTWKFQAVYDPDTRYEEEDWKNEQYILTSDFAALSDIYDEHDYAVGALLEGGAHYATEVVWITYPTHFSVGNHYVSYGNEVSVVGIFLVASE